MKYFHSELLRFLYPIQIVACPLGQNIGRKCRKVQNDSLNNRVPKLQHFVRI